MTRRTATLDRAALARAAAMGRHGDTTLAHLTPGEVVIPPSLQTPRLMGLLADEAAAQGRDPARYVVGDPAGPRNPATLWEEFFDGGGDGEGEGDDGGAPGHGDNGAGVGVGNDGGGDGEGEGDDGGPPGKGDNGTGIGVADSGMFGGMFDAPTGRSLGVMGTGIGMAMGPMGMAVSYGADAAKALGFGIADAFGLDHTVDYSGPSNDAAGAELPTVATLKPGVKRPATLRLPSIWG